MRNRIIKYLRYKEVVGADRRGKETVYASALSIFVRHVERKYITCLHREYLMCIAVLSREASNSRVAVARGKHYFYSIRVAIQISGYI